MGFVLSPDKKSSFQQRSHYGLSHSLEIDTESADVAAASSGGKGKSTKKRLARRARSESWSFSGRRRGDLGIAADRAKESSFHESTRTNLVHVDAEIDSGGNRHARPKVAASSAESALPSQSSLDDLHRVLHLIESERHLVAYELYTDVKKRLDYWREQRDAAATGDGEALGTGGVRVDSNRTADNSEKSMHRGWKKMSWRGNSQRNHSNDEVIHDPSENEEAYKFMMCRLQEFETLEKRAAMFHTAQQNLETPTSWTLSQTLFGITTHYRREADNTLSVKIEGELHGIPLFEQIVVLRECDLYHTWAPFCNESRKLAQLDKLDVVAWYSVGSPLLGLVRDACYRAVGCDCMREDGSVLLVAVGLGDDENSTDDDKGGVNETTGVGQDQQLTQRQQDHDAPSTEQKRQSYQNQRSVTFQESESSSPILNTTATSFLARDAILSTIALPPVPKGLGHARMTIRNFSASIQVLSASSARTKMVVNIDPNLHFLPQSLIDFCMKRMCGVMLARLQAAATKVVKDPIKNPHSRRMREDVRFYRDWLLPKFRTYCDELGWDMPPVKAFDVSEEDLKAEEIFEGWRSADTFDGDNNTEDLTRFGLDDAHAAIQQYQLVDKATAIEGNECTHRRCQSEPSLNSKSRFRTWDLLKQLIPESFLLQQSFELDHDDCTPSRSGQSVISAPSLRGRIRDRPRQFFHDKEHSRLQTKEQKASSDREKALLRLQPEPFSESKALRLKELKDAKARAEERLMKSKGRDKSSGSNFGTVKPDCHTTPIRPESISSITEFEAFRALRRDVVILIVSLLFNAALVPLQSYALTTPTLPPYCDWSWSDSFDMITRILLSLLMIALHATSLWSTMSTFLVIAFDTIDFGQKHLAKNLEHGKRLYTAAVKKYSMILSVAIATMSLCVGFVAALFRNTVYTMCIWFNMEFSLPSFNHPLDTVGNFSSPKCEWISYGASCWMHLVQDSVRKLKSFAILVHQIHIPTVFKYGCIIMSWIATKVACIIPSQLKRLGSSMLNLLFKSLPDALLSQWSVCTNITAPTISWRYEAVRISSFVTTRLGVFILALLFMSYLLLPKPEKKLCQSDAVDSLVNVQLNSYVRSGEGCDGDSLSDVSARTGHSQGKHYISTLSSGSIPMEVIEE